MPLQPAGHQINAGFLSRVSDRLFGGDSSPGPRYYIDDSVQRPGHRLGGRRRAGRHDRVRAGRRRDRRPSGRSSCPASSGGRPSRSGPTGRRPSPSRVRALQLPKYSAAAGGRPGDRVADAAGHGRRPLRRARADGRQVHGGRGQPRRRSRSARRPAPARCFEDPVHRRHLRCARPADRRAAAARPARRAGARPGGRQRRERRRRRRHHQPDRQAAAGASASTRSPSATTPTASARSTPTSTPSRGSSARPTCRPRRRAAARRWSAPPTART